MDDVPRLPDEHLAKAKEFILEHRKKSTCKHCYGRGFQGTDQNNMAVICHRCVDGDAVTEAWRAYVRQTPALAELYGDYFEDDEQEESGADGGDDGGKAPPGADRQRSVQPQDRGRRHGGTVGHRPVGR